MSVRGVVRESWKSRASLAVIETFTHNLLVYGVLCLCVNVGAGRTLERSVKLIRLCIFENQLQAQMTSLIKANSNSFSVYTERETKYWTWLGFLAYSLGYLG